MARIIYLDTHVVAWLYQEKLNKIPQSMLYLITMNQNLISPLVALELTYLYELKRVQEPSDQVIQVLSQEIGLKICDLPFSPVIQSAIQQTWTRDPFDRIIVGQAMVNQCPLVTKDLLIHTHYVHAIWD